jgi:methyl-accepting chemotaxis protein
MHMGRFFRKNKQMSRLKKKLLLYFLLISIVSISVSAEIIFELSSSRFTAAIEQNLYLNLEKNLDHDSVIRVRGTLREETLLAPLYDLRNRMILLLLVVSACIIAAFFMFTRDIVSPMDGMVEATKKIAEGDLTVTVPVLSQDEIGQIGGLINNMNTNLQDMVMQIRQEINRHMQQIIKASYTLNEILNASSADEVLATRRLKSSNFKKMTSFSKDVVKMLENMSDELYALQKFVNMFKTFQVHAEVTEEEIQQALQELNSAKRSKEPV